MNDEKPRTLPEKLAEIIQRAPAPSLPPEALGSWVTIEYRPWEPRVRLLASGVTPERGAGVRVELDIPAELRDMLDRLLGDARAKLARQAEADERRAWLAKELAQAVADEELLVGGDGGKEEDVPAGDGVVDEVPIRIVRDG